MWGQCAQMMKNELEVATNCDIMCAAEDPIALIKNVKGVTHNFKDQKCGTGGMWHAHKQLFSCVQKEEEDTKDHFDRFKNHVEVTENNGGELGTEAESSLQDKTFSELSDAKQKDESDIKAAKERTREKFLAHSLLAGCDEKKFGNLTKDLENDFTFGDNECPVTMQKACEHLMNCKKTQAKKQWKWQQQP